MLVLTRSKGQSIAIGKNIVVTIVRISNDKVRIGIEAPRDIEIVRDDANETASRLQPPENTTPVIKATP